MSELTPEELALLESTEATADEPAKEAPRRGRPARRTPAQEVPEEPAGLERGPHTPAQFDDDGWGDIPVQMRG